MHHTRRMRLTVTALAQQVKAVVCIPLKRYFLPLSVYLVCKFPTQHRCAQLTGSADTILVASE